MTGILLARGVVADRPYVLAVGLYGLGVHLPATATRPGHVVVVHQRVDSWAAAVSVTSLGRVLGLHDVPATCG